MSGATVDVLCYRYNQATAPYVLRTDHEHARQRQLARAILGRLRRTGARVVEAEDGRLRPESRPYATECSPLYCGTGRPLRVQLRPPSPEHPCGRCGRGEAAGAAGLCAACDAEADAADRADACGCRETARHLDDAVREAEAALRRVRVAPCSCDCHDGPEPPPQIGALLVCCSACFFSHVPAAGPDTLEASQAGVETPVVKLSDDEREALRTALEKALDVEGGVL